MSQSRTWLAITAATIFVVGHISTKASGQTTGPDRTLASACESVGKLASLPNIAIDGAELLLPGFTPPREKKPVEEVFCRVRASARPSMDSDIKFEV